MNSEKGSEKVDFKSRQREHWWKYMMIYFIINFGLAMMMDEDTTGSSTSILRLFGSSLLLPLVFYFWYRVTVHKNLIFLLYAIGMTFMLFAMLSEDLGALLLFLVLAVVFILLGGLFFFQVSPLWIYPSAIASAERETDEYLDGYSQRPVDVKFMKYNRENMKRFVSFLLRYIIIWNKKEEQQTITLFFRPAMSFFPRLKKSYIKVHKNGTAEVFITPEDYDFLKVPISYHLLCRNVAERIKRAYNLFIAGDEEGVLELFRVEKKKEAGS